MAAARYGVRWLILKKYLVIADTKSFLFSSSPIPDLTRQCGMCAWEYTRQTTRREAQVTWPTALCEGRTRLAGAPTSGVFQTQTHVRSGSKAMPQIHAALFKAGSQLDKIGSLVVYNQSEVILGRQHSSSLPALPHAVCTLARDSE